MTHGLPRGRRLGAAAAVFLLSLWSGCISSGLDAGNRGPDAAEAPGGGLMPSQAPAGGSAAHRNAEQAPRTSPYEEFVGRRDGLNVWIVDGMYIRNTIDIEFTNFGQHYRFPFIPDHELWIDKEAVPDELEFFIAHLLAEQRLMASGASYEEALDFADGVERACRQRAGDAGKLTGEGRLPDPRKVHACLWKELDSGVRVWVVDGRLVRSVFDVDFTEGGHDRVYEYVPPREIWIDNDLDRRERSYVLIHEIHERNLMAQGWDYERAHADASRHEFHLRGNPDELSAALANEGWNSEIRFHPTDECRGNEAVLKEGPPAQSP